MNLRSEITRDSTIVDVCTQAEFLEGSVAGAVNIPLKEIPFKIEQIRQLKGPIVLCCASGNRSGQAHQFLSERGVECINGGSWLSIKAIKTKNS